MRDATERAGFDLFAGSYWDGLADLAEWEGDLGAALTYSEEALRAQRHSVGSTPVFWYRAHAAGLALEAGEVDRAEAIFDGVDPAAGANAMWWRGLGLHIAALRHDEDGVRRHGAALIEIGADARRRRSAARPRPRAGDAHRRPARRRGAGHLRRAPDRVRAPHRAGRPVPDARPRAAARGPRRLRKPQSASTRVAIARAGDQVRPAALGTAHVGAGRSLVALRRLDDAKEHAAIGRGPARPLGRNARGGAGRAAPPPRRWRDGRGTGRAHAARARGRGAR